jgi:hypothetical protein
MLRWFIRAFRYCNIDQGFENSLIRLRSDLKSAEFYMSDTYLFLDFAVVHLKSYKVQIV